MPGLKSDPVDTSAFALKSDIPAPAISAPVAEAVAPAIGAPGRYATEKHVHERLTSAKIETLDGSSLVTTTFTRTFDSEPCPILTAIAPGGTQPVMLQVDSWIKTGALWTGAVVKGYRGSIPNLATVNVAGITVAAGVQNLNSHAGSAAGVRVSCVFLMPSG